MVNKTMWSQPQCTVLWAAFSARDKLKGEEKTLHKKMQLAETVYIWPLMMSAYIQSPLENQCSFESKLEKSLSYRWTSFGCMLMGKDTFRH